ncbi:MAG: hypothetical protein FJW79_00860 [Actinobacteria bacterium]|nr:hypothetical protein [Actinomycetota bacterium]
MTAPARSLPFPGAAPLRVVVGGARQAPRVGAWGLLAVVVLAAFFLLIYSRVSLDRSAFVLQEVHREMAAEEERYWRLRLTVAELQAPERIVAQAREMGLAYPAAVETIEVPGVGVSGRGAEDRWADLKALLGAQP